VLYNAVYRMGRKLKEREELESYLAGLAEEESIVEGKKVARPPGPVGSDEITLVDAANASDSYRPMPADTSSLTVSSEKHLRDSGAELLNDGARIADRYIVRRVLGAGAMGIVYLAYDEVLDESVALKMINTAKVSTKAVDLLKQETKLCRRISHPNILRNHDFGFEGTQCFISMEFVIGQSLFNLIKDHGPLDVRMGLVLARQMCSAVAAAHREGVVHRDLKPQNMMITRRGVLKVMDFGIAFPAEHVEQSKMVAGTPAFMAPEQFSGQGVDHRCDIYAMGVILFYIFSGRYPFRNRHTESTAEARAAEAIPDVRTFNATVPEAIWSIMRTAMDPLREKRYQSAGEMLVDLGRAGI